MKVGDRIKVFISGISPNGRGVGFYDKYVVIVKGGRVGEEAEVVVEKIEGNVVIARKV